MNKSTLAMLRSVIAMGLTSILMIPSVFAGIEDLQKQRFNDSAGISLDTQAETKESAAVSPLSSGNQPVEKDGTITSQNAPAALKGTGQLKSEDARAALGAAMDFAKVAGFKEGTYNFKVEGNNTVKLELNDGAKGVVFAARGDSKGKELPVQSLSKAGVVFSFDKSSSQTGSAGEKIGVCKSVTMSNEDGGGKGTTSFTVNKPTLVALGAKDMGDLNTGDLRHVTATVTGVKNVGGEPTLAFKVLATRNPTAPSATAMAGAVSPTLGAVAKIGGIAQALAPAAGRAIAPALLAAPGVVASGAPSKPAAAAASSPANAPAAAGTTAKPAATTVTPPTMPTAGSAALTATVVKSRDPNARVEIPLPKDVFH